MTTYENTITVVEVVNEGKIIGYDVCFQGPLFPVAGIRMHARDRASAASLGETLVEAFEYHTTEDWAGDLQFETETDTL